MDGRELYANKVKHAGCEQLGSASFVWDKVVRTQAVSEQIAEKAATQNSGRHLERLGPALCTAGQFSLTSEPTTPQVSENTGMDDSISYITIIFVILIFKFAIVVCYYCFRCTGEWTQRNVYSIQTRFV